VRGTGFAISAIASPLSKQGAMQWLRGVERALVHALDIPRPVGREGVQKLVAETRNNDPKEPAPRFDRYKFLFHRACLATFATQSCQKETHALQQIRRDSTGHMCG
jgi:hypothetical protein